MVKMTIAGITGALITGERSGICATKLQHKLKKVGQSLDLTPRGGHHRESMKRSRKISQMLEFRGSMMSPVWNLQDTYPIKFCVDSRILTTYAWILSYNSSITTPIDYEQIFYVCRSN